MEHHKHNLSVSYVCENCNKSTTPPTHCGQAMLLQEQEGVKNWICWKGEHAPCCGKESLIAYEACCGEPNLVKEPQPVIS